MTTDDPDSFRIPVSRRRETGVMVVLGPVVAYLAVLAAGGHGWSPLLFLLIGAVSAPLLSGLLMRRLAPRRWSASLLALLLVGGLSFGLAVFSTRIRPQAAFDRTFHHPPPAGMTLIAARSQWFDGPNYVISFQATQAAVDHMLAGDGYTDDSAGGAEAMRAAVITPQLDPTPYLPPLTPATRMWEVMKESELRVLIWDPASGRGMAALVSF